MLKGYFGMGIGSLVLTGTWKGLGRFALNLAQDMNTKCNCHQDVLAI